MNQLTFRKFLKTNLHFSTVASIWQKMKIATLLFTWMVFPNFTSAALKGTQKTCLKTGTFYLKGECRVYVQIRNISHPFSGTLYSIHDNQIPRWVLQPHGDHNSRDHVYVSVPRASYHKRKTAILEIFDVNIPNSLASRSFIKCNNIIATASLSPPNWEVSVPGIPVIFVRIPDNDSILAGELRHWDRNHILPEWVR